MARVKRHDHKSTQEESQVGDVNAVIQAGSPAAYVVSRQGVPHLQTTAPQ